MVSSPAATASGAHVSPLRGSRPLGGALGWNLVAEGLALPTGLLTAVFVARTLGPAAYGLLAIATSFVAVLEWMVAALLSRAVIKVVGESEAWRPLAVTAIRLHLVIGLALTAIVMLTAGPLAALLGEPSLAWYLRGFALELPLFALLSAARNVQAGTGDFGVRALSSGIRWIARLILVVGFVWAGFGIPGAIAGSVAAVLVGSVVGQATLGVPWWRGPAAPAARLWSLAAPFFLLALSLRLYDRLGLFVLKALGATSADAGVYAAAQNLGAAPLLLAQTVSPLVLGRIAQAVRQNRRDEARDAAAWSLELTIWLLPVVAFLAGAAGDVMVFVYGGNFASGGPPAAWLLVGSLGSVALTTAASILMASNRSRLALSVTLPLSLFAIAGFLAVVPGWGGTGAAIVTMAVAMAGGLAAAVAAAVTWRLRIAVVRLLGAFVAAGAMFLIGITWPASGPWLLVKSTLVAVPVLATYWWCGGLEGKPWIICGGALEMPGMDGAAPLSDEGERTCDHRVG